MASKKCGNPTTKVKRNRKPHQYASDLKELRPTWKKNPEKIKPMILDMVNKKHPEYVWRYLAMCFIEKFMGIHRVKIKSFQPEIFDEFKHWVMVQGIKYSTTSFLELRKNDYIFRYWTRKDFHLAFLDREIEFNKKLWQSINKVDEEEPDKATISKILEDGLLPKPGTPEFKYLPNALSVLQYIDFLNAEKARLLKEDIPSTVKVPIELRLGDETHEDQLIVQIPAGFSKLLQKEPIKEDDAESDITQNTQASPIPKFYTRTETADILRVSLPKLDQLTREGIIKCHRIGDSAMKRYKIEDIQAGLKQIDYEFSKRYVK